MLQANSPHITDITQNLISLSQDITALVSLSIEATASLAHDMYQQLLARLGLGRAVVVRSNDNLKSQIKSEAGRGLAVVVVGASESELSHTQVRLPSR